MHLPRGRFVWLYVNDYIPLKNKKIKEIKKMKKLELKEMIILADEETLDKELRRLFNFDATVRTTKESFITDCFEVVMENKFGEFVCVITLEKISENMFKTIGATNVYANKDGVFSVSQANVINEGKRMGVDTSIYTDKNMSHREMVEKLEELTLVEKQSLRKKIVEVLEFFKNEKPQWFYCKKLTRILKMFNSVNKVEDWECWENEVVISEFTQETVTEVENIITLDTDFGTIYIYIYEYEDKTIKIR